MISRVFAMSCWSPKGERPDSGKIGAFPLVSVLLTAASLWPVLFGGWAEALQYDRLAVGRGEWWRLATCHWTHWSWPHYLWDAAVFFGLAVACETRRHGRARFVVTVAMAVAAVSACVHWGRQDLGFYRGLSGLDSALYVLLASDVARRSFRDGRWAPAVAVAVLLVLFGAKLGFEAWQGETVFVRDASGAIPAPLAHLAGGCVGLLVGLGTVLAPRRRESGDMRRFSASPECSLLHLY